MTSVTCLRAASYPRMPWRNGGGITAEIAVAPKAATVASGFDWRLSCAEVSVSGAFSEFAGYDRTLVQLSGTPMRLVSGDQTIRLQLGQPHVFAGEDAPYGVVDEPVRDFNCIVRRGRYRAHIESLLLDPASNSEWQLAAPVVAIFVAEGSVKVWFEQASSDLLSGDTLLIEGDKTKELSLRAATSASRVLLVSLVQAR